MDAIPVDDYGRPVPPNMRKAFAAANPMRLIVGNLQRLKTKLSHFTGRDAPPLIDCINQYIAWLNRNRPAAICPKCRGSRCDKCRRRGWISEPEVSELDGRDESFVKRFAGASLN